MSHGQSATYRLRVSLPRTLVVAGEEIDRESFFASLWANFGERGLLGVHEGTLLSEQVVQRGLETESFTVDAALAPRERDWVGGQESSEAELYFASRAEAEAAGGELAEVLGEAAIGAVEEQAPQDWDAEWKASFRGAEVPPFWKVLPPWVEGTDTAASRILRINPGAGFGTGTHETTQLCLQLLGELSLQGFRPARAIDFGSGSGILSIGAALAGAGQVDAVEIDPLANDNARENARLNRLPVDGEPGARIRFFEDLADARGPYPLVLANILKPVLLEFADRLLRLAAPGATVILSGLVEADVAAVSERYGAILGRQPDAIRQNGEWRAILFRGDTRA